MENCEIDQSNDAQAEKEPVGLQVTDLQESKDESAPPGRAAQAANNRAIKNPTIDEGGNRSEQTLGPSTKKCLQFIDIKPIPQNSDAERLRGSFAINGKRAQHTDQKADRSN